MGPALFVLALSLCGFDANSSPLSSSPHSSSCPAGALELSPEELAKQANIQKLAGLSNDELKPLSEPIISPGTPRFELINKVASSVTAQETSSQARENAIVVLRGEISSVDDPLLYNLVAKEAWLVIIPKNKLLTDLPMFSYYQGRKTADGRLWNDIRGVANVDYRDKVYAATGEENLLGKESFSGYKPYFTLVHEWAHMIHLVAMPIWSGDAPVNQINVTRAYQDAVKNKRPFPDSYARQNSMEFFAQCAAIWFAVPYVDSAQGETLNAEWLAKYQPLMFDLLLATFGPPRSITPNANLFSWFKFY